MITNISHGLQLGDFKLIKFIGSGGMAEVWLAKQANMDRNVAVKILNPKLYTNIKFIEKFKKEIKLTAKLEHHNIVTAYAAGFDKNLHFLAMRFIDGAELSNILKIDKTIPEEKALNIIKSLANSLKYAWDEFSIIHCDIKPDNIIIDKNNNPILMDMGISKLSSEIRDDNLEGTVYYMSPEMIDQHSQIDFRADIYSLGITLYQMTTGEYPYNKDDFTEILIEHKFAQIPIANEKYSKVSKQCSYLIEIMLAKQAENRHNSWDKLIEDIDLVLNKSKPRTSRFIKSLRGKYIEYNHKEIEETKCIVRKKTSFLEKILNFIWKH